MLDWFQALVLFMKECGWRITGLTRSIASRYYRLTIHMATAKTSADDRARAVLPLTAVAVQILLALSDRERHGLGIADEIAATTGGRMNLGPGTLYGAMKRLLELDLIGEPAATPAGESADPRRRYYHITPLGRRALALEARAMADVMQVVKTKQVL
jgi:DNA-binding PadR family transcriptional regulator